MKSTPRRLSQLYDAHAFATFFMGLASRKSLRFDKLPSSATSYTYQAGSLGEATARYNLVKSAEKANPFGHVNPDATKNNHDIIALEFIDCVPKKPDKLTRQLKKRI